MTIFKNRLIATIAFCLSALTISTLAADKNPSTVPKVALIGDSIRLSYAPVVIRELKGTAVIASPKANGGDSSNVLKNLERWVIAGQPDLVHFNCGIHDTKKFKATGLFQVSPKQYGANLRNIVKRIREKTDAVVLFATTTPILDERAAEKRQGREYELTGAAIEEYNAIAVRTMRELKVPVNDLNGTLMNPPAPLTTGALLGSDGVHLTAVARETLGRQVARFVRKHLRK
jgi:lysophospholipase L1-like esterase